jgi:hypothetical protein
MDTVGGAMFEFVLSAGDELVLFLMLTLSCPQVALSCCLSALMFFLFHL